MNMRGYVKFDRRPYNCEIEYPQYLMNNETEDQYSILDECLILKCNYSLNIAIENGKAPKDAINSFYEFWESNQSINKHIECLSKLITFFSIGKYYFNLDNLQPYVVSSKSVELIFSITAQFLNDMNLNYSIIYTTQKLIKKGL